MRKVIDESLNRLEIDFSFWNLQIGVSINGRLFLSSNLQIIFPLTVNHWAITTIEVLRHFPLGRNKKKKRNIRRCFS